MWNPALAIPRRSESSDVEIGRSQAAATTRKRGTRAHGAFQPPNAGAGIAYGAVVNSASPPAANSFWRAERQRLPTCRADGRHQSVRVGGRAESEDARWSHGGRHPTLHEPVVSSKGQTDEVDTGPHPAPEPARARTPPSRFRRRTLSSPRFRWRASEPPSRRGSPMRPTGTAVGFNR